MYEKLHTFTWLDGMLAMGLGLVTVGVGYNLKTKFDVPKDELIKVSITPTVVQVYSKVIFDISGQVLKPGVYSLEKGRRVSDAMVLAGGLAVKADREWVEKNINLAKVVTDGEKIYIPKLVTDSTGQEKAVSSVLGSQSQIININTSKIEDLDKLPGVGMSVAQKIIDYRDKNGGFRDVNEIKMVSGIGDKMFEKIKDLIGI